MSNKKFFCLYITVALLLVSLTPDLGSTTSVWSETFDELDSRIWTTESCRIQDGQLRGMEIDSTHAERKTLALTETIWAYRNSSVMVGTWKLDLEEIGGWIIEKSINDMTRIYFILIGTPTDTISYLALSFRHTSSTEGNFLSYRIEKYYDDAVTYLDTYSGEAKETTIGILHHFTITRTSDGLISVYLNNTRILHAVDSDITTTEHFGLYTRVDWALDNIEVSNIVDSTEGIPLSLLATGIGSSFALIAIVFWIKRRES